MQDRRDQIKDETFHLFPQRWAQLYEEEMRAALGLEGSETEQGKPVTDISSIDKWYEQRVQNQEKRFVNGGKVIPPGMGEYWSDWN